MNQRRSHPLHLLPTGRNRQRIRHFLTAVAVGVMATVSPLESPHARASRVVADSSIDVDASGRTLMAGVNVGEPADASVARCTWRTTVISDDQYRPYSFKKINGVTYRWYARLCPPSPSETAWDLTFHWVPVMSDETLATQAAKYAFGTLPLPLVGTSPPAHRGVVDVPMWWWVSRSTWRKFSVTVWLPTPAGPLAVSATARPDQLIIDPADPGARGKMVCTGPGRAWSQADGDRATSSCMHTYGRALREVKARVSIKWAVSWKSNRGAGGRLPTLTTTRTVRVSVHEIQALVSD